MTGVWKKALTDWRCPKKAVNLSILSPNTHSLNQNNLWSFSRETLSLIPEIQLTMAPGTVSLKIGKFRVQEVLTFPFWIGEELFEEYASCNAHDLICEREGFPKASFKPQIF